MALPTSYSWVLATPPPPAGVGPVPSYPTGGAVSGACNGVFHDQSYYLALFDRNLPEDYLTPIRVALNGGYELFQGFAEVGERLSLAIERLECGSFIIFAPGGRYATVVVEFYRDNATAGAVTVKAGTVVTTSQGRDFITTTDAVFGPVDTGPITAAAQAVAPGYAWNVPGTRVTARGETLPGDIDTIKTTIQTDAAGAVGYVDPTVRVRQVPDAAGGVDPMLDGLGADRGLPRLASEDDNAYRYRLRTLPDTVSPGAVRRTIAHLLEPFNETADFIETWDVRYQTCWDAPDQPIPGNPDYDPNLFCYDDPRPAYGPGPGHPVPPGLPFYNRWLDEAEFRGAFIVVLPRLATISDVGMAYDDPGMGPADFVAPSTQGRRGYPAFDVPSDFSIVFGLQGGYDGFDLGTSAVYLGVWQTLQQIKAGGVAAIVEVRGN